MLPAGTQAFLYGDSTMKTHNVLMALALVISIGSGYAAPAAPQPDATTALAPTHTNQPTEESPTPAAPKPEGPLPAFCYQNSTNIGAWAGTAAFILLWGYAQHSYSRARADSYLPRLKRQQLNAVLKQMDHNPERQQVVLKQLALVQKEIATIDKRSKTANIYRWVCALSAIATTALATAPWFAPQKIVSPE